MEGIYGYKNNYRKNHKILSKNEWGHGYMSENNTKVQLSICEFITSKTKNGVGSAKNYPSGAFLKDRYVKKAKIIGHANIE